MLVHESLSDPTRYKLLAPRHSQSVKYDAEFNCASWLIRKGEFSIATRDQFRFAILPKIGAGQSLWAQWDARYDSVWQQGRKTFQFADDQVNRRGGKIQLEVNSFAVDRQTGKAAQVGNYHIKPAIRIYRPGKKCESIEQKYFIQPNQWVRYTLHYDMKNWQLRLWIADESTDPLLVVDSQVTIANVARRFSWFWIELNSSEGAGAAKADCITRARRVLIDSKPIEIGGDREKFDSSY